MNKKKILKVAKAIAVVIPVIVVCVFLASFLRPIPLGLYTGRPDATDFRIMQKDFDTLPYVEAADQFIRKWWKSRGLRKKHWEMPNIVYETKETVEVYFANKEPVLLDNGKLVVQRRLPSMEPVP